MHSLLSATPHTQDFLNAFSVLLRAKVINTQKRKKNFFKLHSVLVSYYPLGFRSTLEMCIKRDRNKQGVNPKGPQMWSFVKDERCDMTIVKGREQTEGWT